MSFANICTMTAFKHVLGSRNESRTQTLFVRVKCVSVWSRRKPPRPCHPAKVRVATGGRCRAGPGPGMPGGEQGGGGGGGCSRVKQGSLPGLSLLENLSVAFMPVTKKHFCPKACRFASYGDCRSREGLPGSSATLVVHVGRAVAGPAAPCPGCHHSCPGQLPSWCGAGFRGHEGSCHPAGLVTCHPQRELRPRPQELL